MKTLVFLPEAAKALRKHRADARRIVAKLQEYAANPAALANNVKRLQGSVDFRLRIGDFRAVFTETDSEIIVSRIGPRGGVYD